jgi:hypothetical protein
MAESDDVNVTEARRWAKSEGYDVPARGALKAEILEAYRNRDQPQDVTPDDAPTGQVDAAGITDEVTTTIDSGDETAEDSSTDDGSTSDGDAFTAYVAGYRRARGIADDVEDAVVMEGSRQRNRVSIQTLENGFIHYQRHAGTDEVQARLVALGFLNGYASGQADENTVQAYARYQDSIGLPGTGIPERTSLEELGFDVIE